jgi:transcriptional regulator with XRE-family HTH domain
MRKDDGKHFGQRLREARVNAGLSQSELEELSGIPKARLSRYENGHVAPSIQTLERLSRALNVSEASLLGDQRAVLEEFFSVLEQRGVRVNSAEQGGRLANAVADLIHVMGVGVGEVNAAIEADAFTPAPSMESVRQWLDSAAELDRSA